MTRLSSDRIILTNTSECGASTIHQQGNQPTHYCLLSCGAAMIKNVSLNKDYLLTFLLKWSYSCLPLAFVPPSYGGYGMV